VRFSFTLIHRVWWEVSATIVLNTARRIIEKREILKTAHKTENFHTHVVVRGNKYKDQNVCSIAGHGIYKSNIQSGIRVFVQC
jgi:hypothetical protein